MANELNENDAQVLKEERDVNVIDKQLPITVGIESVIFEIAIWLIPLVIFAAAGYFMKKEYGTIAIIIGVVVGVLPGIIYSISKVNAGNYLSQLQQKLQHDASQIDNYLEQRVVILQNTAKLLEKAVNLDKDTFTKIAELRSGSNHNNDEERNKLASDIDSITKNINVAIENYPDLKAHNEIEDAMQQNSYLQKEITAAREVYNDSVLAWNREIYVWPTKKIVAAKRGYTTRIPFSTSEDIKQKAREVLF